MGVGRAYGLPLSCAYESFYFLSLILGLVSPTLLCIPYITENDCKINFYGNFYNYPRRLLEHCKVPYLKRTAG